MQKASICLQGPSAALTVVNWQNHRLAEVRRDLLPKHRPPSPSRCWLYESIPRSSLALEAVNRCCIICLGRNSCSSTCWAMCLVGHHYQDHLGWSELRGGPLLCVFLPKLLPSGCVLWSLLRLLHSTTWKGAWPSVIVECLQQKVPALLGKCICLRFESPFPVSAAQSDICLIR